MADLSVIILSCNTKVITAQCLQSLFDVLSQTKKISSEIVIIDNASTDQSVEMLRNFVATHISSNITWKLQENKENVGFPKGNNQGIVKSTGTYILFLNSDVILQNIDFADILNYMNKNAKVGVLTVRVELTSHSIDPASHRGFPTIWNSFCYFFKLEKFLGYIPMIGKIFGGYHLTNLNLNTIHEIDSPTGAFYLTRKSIIDTTGGFDEDYFMYGEDLDLSYRIKETGYQIIYYPRYTVLHLKGSSGIKKKDLKIQIRTRGYFFNAMKIFFHKHYASRYPSFVTKFIYWSIDLKSKL